jgi:hypothetical protein
MNDIQQSGNLLYPLSFLRKKEKMYSLLEMWNSVEKYNAKTCDSSALANCQCSSNIGLLTIQSPDAAAFPRIFS